MFLFNFHQTDETTWIHFIYIWVSGDPNVILTGADILVDTHARFQFKLHFHSNISNQSTKNI